ncbi:putative C2 domain-containing protein [Helianthus debilis subsp. tardiflorus]
MESRTLEIVLHSAKDLYDVKFFGTMDPYATLWIDVVGGGAQEVFKSKVAKKAGTCPVWDYRMEFQLHSMNSNYSLFCEIKHDGKLFDRMIGEVQVPFKDLLASKQKARYPVKTPSGEVQGEIILSHKLSEEVVSNKDGISSTSKKNGIGNRNPKVHSSANKVQGEKKKKKKKNGTVKKIPMNVVRGVATQAIVKGVTAVDIAGTVRAGAGAILATEENIDLQDEDGLEDDDDDDDDDDDEDVQDDDEGDDVVQDDDEDDYYDDDDDDVQDNDEEDDDYDDDEDVQDDDEGDDVVQDDDVDDDYDDDDDDDVQDDDEEDDDYDDDDEEDDVVQDDDEDDDYDDEDEEDDDVQDDDEEDDDYDDDDEEDDVDQDDDEDDDYDDDDDEDDNEDDYHDEYADEVMN